ncbi:TFIIF-stimulated CTD phosphatase, putative [Trypanosoma equiperdum]|uniref:Mitochondrial import inner membrane translocase subunit TIM50 n=1 Tax=Trypanosoma equiperdum TaxID=5694 RepID=A0A1G4I3Q0_TRYEQ|nr:TFIIF-stimulated CTD phosphatase, putative [Trypanosoma equiperdum]
MSDLRRVESLNADTFRRLNATSVVKSFWHTQLRAATAASRGAKDDSLATANEETPVATRKLRSAASSAEKSAGGLTDSTVYSSSSSSSNSRLSVSATLPGVPSPTETRRRLRAAALSAERHRAEESDEEKPDPVARTLFQNFLLQEYDALDSRPVLTVVLDLDETLVSNRDSGATGAILRPYCLHMLNALRHMQGLEVVLWTASTKETAAPVIRQLSQSGPVFDDVICRNSSWFTEPLHTKDLRLLGRDMSRVIIFDNSTACCKLNPRNAVIVDDFRGVRNTSDAALVNVYYIIERSFNGCCAGVSVLETLVKLAVEKQLCMPEVLHLPESWRHIPLREIAPLKVPPHGIFFRAHSTPLNDSIMQHWTV